MTTIYSEEFSLRNYWNPHSTVSVHSEVPRIMLQPTFWHDRPRYSLNFNLDLKILKPRYITKKIEIWPVNIGRRGSHTNIFESNTMSSMISSCKTRSSLQSTPLSMQEGHKPHLPDSPFRRAVTSTNIILASELSYFHRWVALLPYLPSSQPRFLTMPRSFAANQFHFD